MRDLGEINFLRKLRFYTHAHVSLHIHVKSDGCWQWCIITATNVFSSHTRNIYTLNVNWERCPATPCKHQAGSFYSFLTSALDGGEWSASRPSRSLPPGKGPPVPFGQEAGWAPEPVWTQRLEHRFQHCEAHPPGGRFWSSGVERRELFVWRTFILNEIWAQGKIYILLGTLLGWNILLIT
jgi:hypothetical protein